MPILLLLFWIVLNGRITAEIVVLGVVVSAAVSVLAYKVIGLKMAGERKMWSRIFRILVYLVILIWEIIKANIHMIRLVLSPKQEIKPQLKYFKSPVRSDAAKVALANSITLTPGTITIKLEGDEVGVHVIDAPMGVGIEDSIFVTKLKWIEGGH
jgi:multicomponent Na+:H+ antiporter subunit E